MNNSNLWVSIKEKQPEVGKIVELANDGDHSDKPSRALEAFKVDDLYQEHRRLIYIGCISKAIWDLPEWSHWRYFQEIESFEPLPSETKEVKESAEEVLNRNFGGSIGETKVYITDKDLLIKSFEEYASQYQSVPFTEALKKGIPFGESVPISEEEKNIYRAEGYNSGWSDCNSEHEPNQDWQVVIGRAKKENLEKYLSSFLPKKP